MGWLRWLAWCWQLTSATSTSGWGVATSSNSIAAAAIGGVSLAGGSGGVWGTIAGVLLVRMLMNFVLVLQLPIEYQYVVRGAMLILVVALYSAGQKRQE